MIIPLLIEFHTFPHAMASQFSPTLHPPGGISRLNRHKDHLPNPKWTKRKYRLQRFVGFQKSPIYLTERKGNSSNDKGGLPKHSFPEPMFDNVTQSVYPSFSLAEIRATTNYITMRVF